MSTSFEIFPTSNNIPTYEEVINLSKRIMETYFSKQGITYDSNINYEIFNINDNTKDIENSPFLCNLNNKYVIFYINEEGYYILYYDLLSELDIEFWNEEFKMNNKAIKYKNDIKRNQQIGYSYEIKRTVGQPPIVHVYYGFLSIAIASLTNGIIFSDDGAWDYSCFPAKAEEFINDYLDLSTLKDKDFRDFIKNCIDTLR